MKLSFFGADKTVTGSCHCLEVGDKRILIDCGLQQGAGDKDNSTLPFAPGSIDYVLVTHAHIDHSGRLPLLVKQGSVSYTHLYGECHTLFFLEPIPLCAPLQTRRPTWQ